MYERKYLIFYINSIIEDEPSLIVKESKRIPEIDLKYNHRFIKKQ